MKYHLTHTSGHISCNPCKPQDQLQKLPRAEFALVKEKDRCKWCNRHFLAGMGK